MWKDVVGYEDLFLVSSSGEIFSKRTKKILKQHNTKAGYLCLSTRIGGRKGKCVLLRVHRLVAEAFLSNPEDKPFVNHKNGRKDDNNFLNLEWVTSQENAQHAWDFELNTKLFGENNPNSKLTSEQILFAKTNSKEKGGTYSYRKLGKLFNVKHTTISKAVRGESYR